MSMRDIFVPIFQDVSFDAQLEAAAELALRLEAHVNVVFARRNSVTAAAMVPEMIAAAGVVAEAIEAEGRKAEAAAFDAFGRWKTAFGMRRTNESADGAGADWHVRVGSIAANIIEIARVSDLAVIPGPDPYEILTEEAFAATVFDSGRPALLIPRPLKQSLFHHVVIAWNGSLQAARAVDGAMPILRHADKVSIFAPSDYHDQQKLGLVDHLSHHGIQPDHLAAPPNVSDIGKALLESAAAAQATMIVMGAYSHSRMREMLLGGVTQHVLKHADIPVLMMH